MVKSINPYTQSVVATFETMDERTVSQKLTQASDAFMSWRKESIVSRCDKMQALARVLRVNQEKYAQLITSEMGKTISESRGEVEKCAATVDYFVAHAETFLQNKNIVTEGKRSYVSFEPIGAVFAIMPWNFPFWQVLRFAIPSLLAGNVALLKHASNVSGTSLAIQSIFEDAGFPEHVFQSLIIDTKLVEQIISTPIVQGVTLTGSEQVGASVASLAGKHIRKSVMELGGSDAFIVLADADLVEAAKVATQSRMRNAGQSCIAAKRFIVEGSVKDAFTHLFMENIKALRQGDPLNEQTTTGPVARLDLAETVEKQMTASVRAGAKLLTGGQRNGCNFIPALLDHVRPGMPAFDEEVFGPVAAVITATNEADAVALANQSPYGLGAALWTRDLDRAAHLAKDIQAGSVFVNSLVRSDARLPFGGIKKSGYGRELSDIGMHEFVNIKTVFME